MNRKLILVVDDDPHIRDYLSSIFEDNGYRALAAADAPQALEILKIETPDLITLDLEMPGEWGPRFYRRICKDPKLAKIPVIVISGLSGNAYAISRAAASFNKPFDPDALVRAVAEALA